MDARPAGAGLISAQLTLISGGRASDDFGRALAGSLGRFHGNRPAGLCWIVGMELKLYDTLTREKRVFAPIDPQRCAHVCVRSHGLRLLPTSANARPVIVFDVLFRLLRHLAKQGVWDGGKAIPPSPMCGNITDVDYKINARGGGGISRPAPERGDPQGHRENGSAVPRGRGCARLPAAHGRAARDRAHRRDVAC